MRGKGALKFGRDIFSNFNFGELMNTLQTRRVRNVKKALNRRTLLVSRVQPKMRASYTEEYISHHYDSECLLEVLREENYTFFPELKMWQPPEGHQYFA